MCKQASQKLHALARISHFISTDKLKLLMKAFIDSQFNYCPLVWMFHNRNLNNRINKIHERALRLVYKNPNCSFEELLQKDKSFTIHDRNLQKLAIEMFKVKNNLSPVIMKEIFEMREPTHNLRNNRCWLTHNVRTEYFGKETITYRGPKVWEMLPSSLQNIKTLTEFKNQVKSWKPEGCTCRLCKLFVPSLGFL